jgi:hypothetical protein
MVTVTDALPAGLTATGISGDGWTADLNSLTCTRTDALPAGQAYPLITVTVAVATNAPANVTNTAAVSGGGETNIVNDTASDPTPILASNGGTNVVALFGWDVQGQPGGAGNFGVSPLSATTNASNLVVTGLTRGSGVATSGTGAAHGWGGDGFTASTAAAAISANQFITFGATVASGYTVSYSAIGTFCYRHSGTGPAVGLLQYQLGSGAFNDITPLAYPTNTSGGSPLSPVNLSGIAALQNVGPVTNVTFRIVNYGGGSSGTWYIYDVSNSAALDLAVQGSIAPVVAYPPAAAPSFSASVYAPDHFQFLLNGTMGSNYVVQASTNLLEPAWISLQTNTAPFVFVESNLYPQRFYRAIVEP